MKKFIDIKSKKKIYKPKILVQQQKLPIGNSKAKKKKLRLINLFYQKQTTYPLKKPLKQNNFVITNKRHTLHTHNNNNKRKPLPTKL